jgi:WD40 repeat protein
MIEEALLQAYLSAIILALTESVVRQQFTDQLPHWLRQLPKTQRDWSRKMLSLEGHTALVHAVSFSSNGELLTSGSEDCTFRLWKVGTGKACGTLESHSDCVAALAFLPDGRRLASASRDGTIRLLHLQTGASCGLLKANNLSTNALAFSPDSALLA